MRLDILKTLIWKEAKEYFRNPSTTTMLSVSVGLIVALNTLGDSGIAMTTMMPLTFLGLYAPAFLFAEEKERKTLGALLVSPARPSEIIFGKIFLCAFVTFTVTSSLVQFFYHTEVDLLHSLTGLLLGTTFLCLIGTVIGLISPNQAMVNSVGTVLMMLFMLAEALQPLSPLVGHIARALPTHHPIQILLFSTSELTSSIVTYYAISLLFLAIFTVWVGLFLSQAGKQESNNWHWSKRQMGATAILFAFMVAVSVYLKPQFGYFEETKFTHPEFGFSVDASQQVWTNEESRFGHTLHLTFSEKTNKESKFSISAKPKRKGATLKSTETTEKKNKKSGTVLVSEERKISGRSFLFRKLKKKRVYALSLMTIQNGYSYTLKQSVTDINSIADAELQITKLAESLSFAKSP